MRLKPAGIIIIVLIIAALAYFAFKPRMSELRKENSTELSNTSGTRDNDTSNTKNSTSTVGDANSEEREFNYTPEKPVNGALRGVVELGATGFNSFVINMDNQKRLKAILKAATV